MQNNFFNSILLSAIHLGEFDLLLWYSMYSVFKKGQRRCREPVKLCFKRQRCVCKEKFDKTKKTNPTCSAGLGDSKTYKKDTLYAARHLQSAHKHQASLITHFLKAIC